MAIQDTNSVIDDYYSALGAMDWDRWVSLFSPTGVRHEIGGLNYTGDKELRAFISGIGGLFQSVSIRADSTYATDHGTAVRWLANGVGINGRHVEFSGIDVFRINNDEKIVEEWAYWDPAPIISELSS